MTYRFHVHFSPLRPGLLDAYSPPVNEAELRERILRFPLPEPEAAWCRVKANLQAHVAAFSGTPPVRIPARRLLLGLPDEAELWLQRPGELERIDYEPLYGADVKQMRDDLDQRLVHLGPAPGALLADVAPAVEDLRQARNRILDFVMTSTFRIVLSRTVVDSGEKQWLVISTRDTDRQDPAHLDVAVCAPTGPRAFHFHARPEAVPSSSLESSWHCHRHLRELALPRSAAVLHCHALATLDLDRRARAGGSGRRIDDEMRGVRTVPGISRTPAFGEAVAEALGGGMRMAFRAGEGVWTAEGTALGAADTVVEIVREIEARGFSGV